jgi:integrase
MFKLKASQIKSFGPGRYDDGGSLRLHVGKLRDGSAGSRNWILRITINSKRVDLGLGSFPAVSLADARERAANARALVAQGIDPRHKPEPEQKRIFTSVAAEYIRVHRRGWKNRKHGRQWVSTLKTYARPFIGGKSFDEITTDDALAILRSIWLTKTETAKRLQGRLEVIFDYAVALKLTSINNPCRWKGHLDKLLPAPAKIQKRRHHPAMPYDQVPAFIKELEENESVSSLALQFLILTATRTGEVISAEAKEFDLTNRLWTVPPERMKSKREHRVPLSCAAVAVLGQVISDRRYVFPGRRDKPVCNMSLLSLMRRMGYGLDGDRGPYVPHGFRSSFRDWAGEVSIFPSDVCEMALAHVIPNKTEAAYRRGDLLEKRRELMEAWAEYCTNHLRETKVL